MEIFHRSLSSALTLLKMFTLTMISIVLLLLWVIIVIAQFTVNTIKAMLRISEQRTYLQQK